MTLHLLLVKYTAALDRTNCFRYIGMCPADFSFT